MWKRKKPIRLEKRISLKERFQNWTNRHYGTLVFIGTGIALFAFVAFFLLFMPGTESGVWYNKGV